MARRRNLLRVLPAAAGVPYAAWRYWTEKLEIERHTEQCGWPIDGFPGDVCAYDVDSTGMQRPRAGCGPAFHRRYTIAVGDPVMTPEQLVAVIAADPNVASPMDLARFFKRSGSRHTTQVGDEYEIVLPGPWNGPVRVIDRTPLSFRFATLDSHMEAGEIEFRAAPEDDGLSFEIESWARSADPVFHLLYHGAQISMRVQEHMWAQFLKRAARVSGGTPGRVLISTRASDRHDL